MTEGSAIELLFFILFSFVVWIAVFVLFANALFFLYFLVKMLSGREELEWEFVFLRRIPLIQKKLLRFFLIFYTMHAVINLFSYFDFRNGYSGREIFIAIVNNLIPCLVFYLALAKTSRLIKMQSAKIEDIKLGNYSIWMRYFFAITILLFFAFYNL